MSAAPPETRATATSPALPGPSAQAGGKPMSHREVLEALTGLMAALFTAMLSSTIVSTALPTILADLKGTQSQYTWIITASLLATTISTPIWGKLSDLASKKVLVQLRGACSSCMSAQLTLKQFVETRLRDAVEPDLIVEEVR